MDTMRTLTNADRARAAPYLARAAAEFEVEVEEITGRSRRRMFTESRWAVSLALYHHAEPPWGQPLIGALLGQRDASTIAWMVGRAEMRSHIDPDFKRQCAAVASGLPAPARHISDLGDASLDDLEAFGLALVASGEALVRQAQQARMSQVTRVEERVPRRVS